MKLKSFVALSALISSSFACASGPEQVSLFAGTSEAGYLDGDRLSAQLNRPHGMAQDSNGKVFFADRGNHKIRFVDQQSGVVVTLAGSGDQGFSDGVAPKAAFNQPVAVAVDSEGVVYVADRDNHRIRKIDLDRNVTTLAGSGEAGFQDGESVKAQFNEPYGVVLNQEGTHLLVADYLNHAIRRIDLKTSDVTTVAGNGEPGFEDGDGENARFYQPYNIAIGSNGDYFIPDQKNHAVRKLNSSWQVSTLAGSGKEGYKDGQADMAEFNNPTGVAVDPEGQVYVADRNNHRIRVISGDSVSTLAGNGEDGGQDAAGTGAQFSKPLDIVLLQNSDDLLISEDTGHRLRLLD